MVAVVVLTMLCSACAHPSLPSSVVNDDVPGEINLTRLCSKADLPSFDGLLRETLQEMAAHELGMLAASVVEDVREELWRCSRECVAGVAAFEPSDGVGSSLFALGTKAIIKHTLPASTAPSPELPSSDYSSDRSTSSDATVIPKEPQVLDIAKAEKPFEVPDAQIVANRIVASAPPKQIYPIRLQDCLDVRYIPPNSAGLLAVGLRADCHISAEACDGRCGRCSCRRQAVFV